MNDYLVKLYYNDRTDYLVFKHTQRKAVNNAILALETRGLLMWKITKVG